MDIPWLAEYYKTADIIVGEARHFLETSNTKFDLIYYAFLDPKAILSENIVPDVSFLYTRQGIKTAYSRLSENGWLIIRRVYIKAFEEEFIERHCSTLTAAGIKRDQILFLKSEKTYSQGALELCWAVIVVAKNSESIYRLKNEDTARGTLIEATWKVKEESIITDSHPFSFIPKLKFSSLLDIDLLRPYVLVFIIFLLIASGFFILSSLSSVNFFLLGYAYMLFESIVIYHSFLLIGNPSLSAGIAIGVFLISNSFGSMYSENFKKKKKLLFILPAVVFIFGFFFIDSISFIVKFSPLIRLLWFSLILFPLGFLIGTLFPIFLRCFIEKSVSYLYFIDLIGCAVAPLTFSFMMVMYGLTAPVMVSFMCYFIVIFILNMRD